ncbi:helix-turn-helix domain-containing protein [Streptomyces sp. SL13]|uniref:Helix-turn-helix domain-containing protein n=1 Tax=Streptantibioticus silvisoli TaxID=2705255 RepID=A0AA90HAK4_9ACTN|nr:helix-turn-helix domain-containing protein [Streptantibioticus silvisoli]MDI5974371.1 helix-turn-helix domain-containing protein [Streptantibioticus silvisoli]
MDAVPRPTGGSLHLTPQPGAARHALLRLVTVMLDRTDERGVLWEAMVAIAATGPFTAEAAYTVHDGLARRCPPRQVAAPVISRPGSPVLRWPAADPSRGTPADVAAADVAAADRLDRRIDALDGHSRHLDEPGVPWARAIALRYRDHCLGYLVVRSLTMPSAEESALTDLLAQQTGIALARLTGYRAQPARVESEGMAGTGELPESGNVRGAADGPPTPGLTATVSALASRLAVQDALSRAAVSGGGEQGILHALHDHTGFTALTEDRFGNTRARAGPRRGESRTVPGSRPYPQPGARRRTALMDGALRRPGTVRDRDRLIVPIQMAGDLLGVVALVDPDRRATETDTAALEQAALVLAPQLAHEYRLAELEPRLRSALVDRLISGGTTDDVFTQAAALGHDLHRPHRVAALEWPGTAATAVVGEAVVRVAGRLRREVLVGSRGATTVALVTDEDRRDPGSELHRALSDELGTGAGTIGVGGRCDVFTDLPHSYDEAVRALTIRRRSQDPYGSTGFEELGLCRMMGAGDGQREADRFVREWLGRLLDYDARHHTELVTTLSRYLESGGSYDTTSRTLLVHRSTVRYRLQRIGEITGHDLSDVGTRLNLHVATRIRNVLDVPH